MYKYIKSELAEIDKKLIDLHPPIKTPISKYESFLEQLKFEGEIINFHHLPNGFLRNAYMINGESPIKLMRSKKGINHEMFAKSTFSYQIQFKSARLFKQRKLKALVLILEENPVRYVSLPTGYLIETVLKKENINQNSDWQIKIKRTFDNKLLLESWKNIAVDY